MDEESLFEKRLKAIQNMPEGPEKTQAIQDLSRDYAGRTERAQGNLKEARDQLAEAMVMPTARTAGPSSNPFAIAVAPNPMEYLAQGLRAYGANKRRTKAQEELETLSQGQESGLSAVMRGAMGPRVDPAQAATMRTAGFGTAGLTPEEEEELLRRRMMGI